MKKALAVVFSICLMLITGCSGATGYNVEQTNLELSVIIDGMTNFELNNVLEAFEAQYPDIKLVNLNPTPSYEAGASQQDDDDFQKKIATEIMAGGGPDIFVIDRSKPFFNDVGKTMKSGAFYDINKLLKGNKNYDRDNYIDAAMKACEYDGAQYIFPVSIEAPILVTTKEIIENTGIDLNKCKNYFDFMNELGEYHKRAGPSNQRASIAPLFGNDLGLLNAYDKEVTFDTDEVRQALQIYKECEENSSKYPLSTAIDDSHIGLFSYNKIIFSDRYFGFDALLLSAMLNEKFEPILLPKYNSKGQIQTTITCGLAVNANSPNLDNVAKFFDILLTNDQEINVLDNEEYKKLPGYDGIFDNIPLEDRYIYTEERNTVPTKKSNISKELELLEKKYNDGYIYNIYEIEKSRKITPLSPNYYEQFADICDNIEVCTLPTGLPWQVYNYFTPYFNDEKSLDECIQTAQSTMEIYISE